MKLPIVRSLLVVSLLFVAPLATAQVRPAPIRFTDRATQCGILSYDAANGMGSGVLAADYDDDGDIDLFVPNGEGVPDQLYRNRGDGTFEEIAARAGLDSLQRHRASLFFDYDGDGDLDLIVGNDDQAIDPVAASSFHLFRQDGPESFTDVTREAGLFVHARMTGLRPHRGGFCAGDLDRDGDLDLCATMWNGQSQLFRNEGDGTFTDISTSSGVFTEFPVTHWQPLMGDFDGDGWQDIFMAVDFFDNQLWINQKDGTFVDKAKEAGVNYVMNGMGAAVSDVNNDGKLDIGVTNIFQHTFFDKRNLLQINLSTPGQPKFAEISVEAGVADGGWGWGMTFFDADRDGRVDWASTNGFESEPWDRDPTCFFFGNQPRLQVQESARAVGLADNDWGSGLIAFDFDRDGDLDVAQTCMNGTLRLMENQPSVFPSKGVRTPHYLVVKPRAASGNRFGIGAKVLIQVGADIQCRVITAGTSFLSQEPAEAFFGLGDATLVDRVHVTFADGTTRDSFQVPVDQVLTILK